MRYIDGIVMAVPTKNKDEYEQYVRSTVAAFKEHGALQLIECWGDDVPSGEVTSFPIAVKCQADETVCLSFIVWPSREARDEGMKHVMADPRVDPKINPMPFDGQRMIYGGFEVLVDA